MSATSKLPTLKVLTFKPSPYSDRKKMLNLFDCLDDSPELSTVDLESSVKANRSDLRRELRNFKVALGADATSTRRFKMPKIKRRNLKPEKLSRSPEPRLSQSQLAHAPLSRRAYDTPRLRRKMLLDRTEQPRDSVEEFIDNLIKNREELRLPADLSQLKAAKLRKQVKEKPRMKPTKANTRSSQAISPEVKQHVVLSKHMVSYDPLRSVEGEDRLKNKIIFFRNEISRLLNKVEEFVIEI